MARQKVHTITVKIRFDKPINKDEAKREFRDCVHGDFYPGFQSDAETMKIVSVT